MTKIFNESDFRHCVGHFATGITVITTKDAKGKPCGMTVNSFASVSLDPTLILFCIDKSAHNYDNFKNSDDFVVNILAEGQEEISRNFAHPSSVNWKNISYTTDKTAHPLINGVIAYLECKKKNMYDGGDHSIFIGEVTNLENLSDDKPLLYYKGEYSNIKGEVQ